jgi:hypothetical protein
LAVLSYFRFGRRKEKPGTRTETGDKRPAERRFWEDVWVGTTHCGAGCTLGDVAAEWAVFLGGFALFGTTLASSYVCDFTAAYILGVVFQYFSIAPMRNLRGMAALRAAIKADTVSLVAFEIGLFAFMFWMHRHFRPPLEPTQPEYWFLMQIGMILGFCTSYPANWWLIRKKWKEAM